MFHRSVRALIYTTLAQTMALDLRQKEKQLKMLMEDWSKSVLPFLFCHCLTVRPSVQSFIASYVGVSNAE